MEANVRRGRAYVRIIEAIDDLLSLDRHSPDNAILNMLRRFAGQRLLRLLGAADAAAVVAILGASDKLPQRAREIVLN